MKILFLSFYTIAIENYSVVFFFAFLSSIHIRLDFNILIVSNE